MISPGRVLVEFLTALETAWIRALQGSSLGRVPAERRWIVEAYRRRSAILGREVRVFEDAAQEGHPPQLLAEGRVERIGDGLELYLTGSDRPVTRGRLEWRGEEEGRE